MTIENTPQTHVESQTQPGVADMGALLKQLLNNDYIPPDITNEWWVLTSDDIVLSFHDKQDIIWLMNQFDLLELRTIRALTGHAYDLKTVRMINMIKMVFFAKLNRSKDGGERKAQTTQITSTIITEGKPEHVQGTGFFSQAKRILTGSE